MLSCRTDAGGLRFNLPDGATGEGADLAKIRDIASRPDLNGRLGKVQGYDPLTSRYTLALLGAAAESVAVKEVGGWVVSVCTHTPRACDTRDIKAQKRAHARARARASAAVKEVGGWVGVRTYTASMKQPGN